MRNELSRYKWRVDKWGKTINEPVDAWNHLIDPLRYVALNKLKVSNDAKLKSRLPFAPNHRAETGVFEELIGSRGLS